jgi:transposase-like protein
MEETMERTREEASGAMAPDAAGRTTEVPTVGRKRRYSEAYKLRILEEADQCKRGELGALLRREGLYHATITKWRTWRDTMADKGFTPEQDKKAMRKELARLQRENKRLKFKLERQEAMLDLQKKAFQILDLTPPDGGNGGKS